MYKFNLEDWEQSLKYIKPSDLNIPKYEYQVYKESKDIPERIRYACFYLSIVDKALAEWMGSPPYLAYQLLVLPYKKKDFLEGDFNYQLTLDCLSVNLGDLVWKNSLEAQDDDQ